MALAAAVASAIVILYTTVLSRLPTLGHYAMLSPFWSYAQVLSGQRSPNGILLNIALFVSLGWFLASMGKQRRLTIPLLLSIFFSITIELIQYYTGRGTADIDDVISNTLGGAVGAGLYYICSTLTSNTWKRIITPVISVALLIAGCIGAYETYCSPHLNSRLREYDFVIEEVFWNEDNLTISGRCSVYDGETPAYQLILSDRQTHQLNTVIDGGHFTATGEAEGGKKYELLIHFTGHETMSTGTWIYGADVEFAAGELPAVDDVPDGAVLKAYDETTDTLIYQDGNRILWLIGTEIEPTTEIIYHIHTDEKQKLPENRIKYGFDNRGFRLGTEKELEPIGKYRVFEKEIPSEYHVAEVIVGFNTGGKLIWEQNFRVDYD